MRKGMLDVMASRFRDQVVTLRPANEGTFIEVPEGEAYTWTVPAMADLWCIESVSIIVAERRPLREPAALLVVELLGGGDRPYSLGCAALWPRVNEDESRIVRHDLAAPFVVEPGVSVRASVYSVGEGGPCIYLQLDGLAVEPRAKP